MRALLALVLVSGCIWVTDDELMERTLVLQDEDGDGALADVYGGTDCNDQDASIHPGMVEEPYDGLDNDCNPLSLDDDLDGDGFGIQEDCEDENPAIHPDSLEYCDEVDNNCDGTIDETTAEDALVIYLDSDGDGFGDQSEDARSCTLLSGWVEEPEDGDDYDCNDSDPTIHPGASEYCDGQDNDCDSIVDEQGALDQLTWYPDRDSDGFGDSSGGEVGCSAPVDYLDVAGDCDDGDPNVHPFALENLGDMEDRDCDGAVDGFSFYSINSHASAQLTGPRMVMVPTSGGPLLYVAWMAGKCVRPTDEDGEVLTGCMLFTTLDFESWSTIQEGEQDVFIEASADAAEQGSDGDFVASPIYAGWVRDVATDAGPQLRITAMNRVTEDTAEMSMDLDTTSIVSRVQASLDDETITTIGCTESGDLSVLSLCLDDLADDGTSWTSEWSGSDIPAGVCEIDARGGEIRTAEYGGDLTSWTVDLSTPGTITMTESAATEDHWFLDLEHHDSSSAVGWVGSHDDASSRLLYSFELLGAQSEESTGSTSGIDWVYTSEIFTHVDLTITDEGVGWVCGVTHDFEPYLVSVDLDAINPVNEYPLTTSVGLGTVEDCTIASATIEMDWVSMGDLENVVTTQNVEVVVVAYRSETGLKWGVVEAY